MTCPLIRFADNAVSIVQEEKLRIKNGSAIEFFNSIYLDLDFYFLFRHTAVKIDLLARVRFRRGLYFALSLFHALFGFRIPD